jgi:hypothetical protein
MLLIGVSYLAWMFLIPPFPLSLNQLGSFSNATISPISLDVFDSSNLTVPHLSLDLFEPPHRVQPI